MIYTIDDVEEVVTRVATPDDDDLPAYDNTRLVAINTCPTWGIVRYGVRKRMPGSGRAMALEAGSACHEVFAAARIWQLFEQGYPEHGHHHGRRIFGPERFESMMEYRLADESHRTRMMNFCLEALYSCGYYDDPMDKRRTLANLEEACIAYLDRFDFRNPVWVQDEERADCMVGVEIGVNVVIEFKMPEPIAIRFIGRVDGIHWHKDELRTHENKTGSRMNDAWADSMLMTHQITGYMVAIQSIIGRQVDGAQALGLAIPLPRSIDYGGYIEQPVKRTPNQFHEWFDWVLHTVQLERQYIDRPHMAPKYTHSCNRYFRPCSLIPFCGVSPEERLEVLEEMEDETWSPLDEVAEH